MPAFLDARSDDVPETIEGSVCIVGAGAAGITLARSLGHDMKDVILVESGGMEIDGATQNLFAGKQLGLPYFNLISCRLRYFGGTTNHWSGYCRANDPVDYDGRPEIGLPAWPFGHEELAPYIAEAGDSLGIQAAHFDPSRIVEDRDIATDNLAENHSDTLLTKVFQFARKRRLGRIYQDDLQDIAGLKGILNLNLWRIQLSENAKRVENLICKTLNGKTVTVKADAYVICCHGIENARLLLASNDVMAQGVGNAHDHVGRYFMDHIHIHASKWIPSPQFPKIYDRIYAGNQQINANISFTDAYTREAELLQYYCRFDPIYMSQDTKSALAEITNYALEPGSLDYLRDVTTVMGDLGGAASFTLSRLGYHYALPDFYEMDHRLEQAPNPDSRVVLSDRVDALGAPIADLDWRINDHDVNSFKNGQSAIAAEMSALGWGRIQEEEITRDLVEDRVEGHYHQIGTTRMSTAPQDGVVDGNCQVHGVDNLYIGGSSVFPTAGYSGPTMMIIAMALRLSDHLKRRLT